MTSGPASDWGPDSPATTRFRAFYDWPAPVEFEATLPDDLDGPEDERQFLLDEAPFAKLAAVRVERADLPPSVAAPGRTPVAEGDGTPEERTDDLRADLARRLARSEGWSQPTHMHHVQADELISQGWRLVSEDDATVTAVGQAIMHALARVAGEDYDSPKAAWSEVGRAAVRALREAGE